MQEKALQQTSLSGQMAYPQKFVPHFSPIAWLILPARLPGGDWYQPNGYRRSPEGVSVWVGPGKHFVGYRLRQSSLMNFIAVEERDEWTEENWMLPGDIEKLRTAFAGWDTPVQDILAACDDTYLWGLFDRPPPKTWHSSRAVLIGDACHPILPFMAQGAAMAIEDAYVLAASLEKQHIHCRRP